MKTRKPTKLSAKLFYVQDVRISPSFDNSFTIIVETLKLPLKISWHCLLPPLTTRNRKWIHLGDVLNRPSAENSWNEFVNKRESEPVRPEENLVILLEKPQKKPS